MALAMLAVAAAAATGLLAARAHSVGLSSTDAGMPCPPAVVDLNGEIDGDEAMIHWDLPQQAGYSGIDVFVDDLPAGHLSPTETTFQHHVKYRLQETVRVVAIRDGLPSDLAEVVIKPR